MSTKEQVLTALMEADQDISGEHLAQKLGVSRNSVWKAIEALRAEGHEIEAVTHRGYRLSGQKEVLSEAGIRRHLTRKLGLTMEVHREIDSTNTRAKALAAQGAAHGTLVCAAGRPAAGDALAGNSTRRRRMASI